MKKIIIIISFFISCSFSAHAENLNQKTVVAIESFMAAQNIPGIAVEMYIDGKPYSYIAGYADIQNKTKLTKNSIFELGSISKIFTSLLLAQEVDFAKVYLSDALENYLPGNNPHFNKISLLNLATYTGGFPFRLPNYIKSNQEALEYFKHLELANDPGEEWLYSNVSIGLLGYILETTTKFPLNKLYVNHIANPLKMLPVGITYPAKYQKYLVQGYTADNTKAERIKNNIFPAGYAFKSTPENMQKFLKAAIGLPGTPSRISYPMKLTQSKFIKLEDGTFQGLGWQITPISEEALPTILRKDSKLALGPIGVDEIPTQAIFNGDHLIDKTGATDGFRSYIAVIPNKKTGIVILTNKYIPDSKIKYLGRKLLFANLPSTDQQASS